MASPRPPKAIGVFGYVGNQNLGDEAIIATVIQNIRRRYPDRAIYGFTRDPEDTRLRHGVTAFPLQRPVRIRRAAVERGGRGEPASPGVATPGRVRERLKAMLRGVPGAFTLAKALRDAARVTVQLPGELAFAARCYRVLRGVDLLIIAGSQQLNDYWTGAWGHPFTLYKWSLIARAAGTRVAFVSVGAGPLTTRLGRSFVRRALVSASYRSFRDETSRDCVAALGVTGEQPIIPDLVLGLELEAPPPRDAAGRAAPVVGLNPMPWYRWGGYWPEANARAYDAYARALAGFADWLIERGYRVSLFPTQLLVDPCTTRDVRALMHGDDVVEADISSFTDLVAAIGAYDFVVATRYHGALLSLLLHKPVLAIAYQEKSRDLMRCLGQSEHALDIELVDLQSLKERFVRLESRSNEIPQEIRSRLPTLRQGLGSQYDRIFGLLEQTTKRGGG